MVLWSDPNAIVAAGQLAQELAAPADATSGVIRGGEVRPRPAACTFPCSLFVPIY